MVNKKAQYASYLKMEWVWRFQENVVWNGIGKKTDSKYVFYGLLNQIIGYSNGESTNAIRVFVDANGYFHGFPVTWGEIPKEFRDILEGKKKPGEAERELVEPGEAAEGRMTLMKREIQEQRKRKFKKKFY